VSNKKFLASVLLAAVGFLAYSAYTPRDPVEADLGARVLRKGYFALRYDLDSAGTLIFCTSVGGSDSVWDVAGIPGGGEITNSGSSTTITSSGTTGAPFTNVAVHDTLLIDVDGTIYPRQVLARTDANTVTVDEAIDLSADDYEFTYRDQTCDTGADDGWAYIGDLHNVLITFNMPQVSGDGNGIDVRLEGMDKTDDGYDNPSQLWPLDKTVGGAATVQNFTTAGIASNQKIFLLEPVEYIRIGLQHSVADDGTDTTTDAEQITVTIVGEE
jgi:hypothetical protein